MGCYDSFPLKYNNADFINRYAFQIKILIIWGVDKGEGTLFIYEAILHSDIYPL
jgi:hypothetical protein